MKKASHSVTLALAAVLGLGSQVLIPQASFALGQSAQTDNNVQAELQNNLKKYKGVTVSVKNGIVDLEGTINTLQSMQNDADTSVQKFLTGENEELHTTVLATQRAEMAFELGLQVRNKVVSAYQEIMKMQL